MKKLSYENFKVMERFIYYRARDLEIAQFNNLFLDSGSEDILQALSIYQNRDGGFGHGLEPDNLNPYSSAAQTTKALQILKLLGYDDSNLDKISDYIINRALHYIYYYEFKNGKINPCVPSNNNFPHAKWWDYKEDFFSLWGYNPTVNIVAYTLLFKRTGNKYYDKAFQAVPELIKYFLAHNNHDKYQFKGYLELYEVISSKNLFIDLQLPLKNHLDNMIELILDKNPENWGKERTCTPLSILTLDEFINTSERKILIEQHLDFLIDFRNENGIYNLTWNWNWGNEYKEYTMQKVKWQGIKTIEYLYCLKKYNRIILEQGKE